MSVPRREATFGGLLREHRLAARLTQEALSERSGVSPRTIQEVESGSVHPRRSTALSLVDALSLSDHARDELLRTAASRPRQHPSTRGGVSERGGAPDVRPLHEPAAEPATREPALVALPRPVPTNLPWPVSSLLGREGDLAAIRDLIVERRQRLVTLTGVGGSGKTRLAIQAAKDLLDQFADGVWLVELASTADPALVVRSVAGVLGVHEVSDATLLDALLGIVRRKRLLLVLDNCEHLISACAELAARLLAVGPDLAILVTSREPLQIAGEQRWPVRPLAVPDPRTATSFQALGEIASVRLFVERARAIDPELALTERNADAVAQICARLDGIPLAIELAASRIKVLSAQQIAARLDGSFRLLAGGARTGPTRQQTMEAALDWSYNLLSETEQAAFRALSTFAGGFDLEAAERVASEQGSHSLLATHDSLLDVLGSLVDKSLVVAERTQTGRRYRLLEPVRQYAELALAARGERDGALARHAAYYAALVERAAPLLHGPEQIDWLDRLETERDNLRATLTWTTERGDPEAGLRLAVALAQYWVAHGYLSEGRRWLDLFLTEPRLAGSSDDLRLQATMAAGVLALWQGDLAQADDLLSRTVQQAQVLGDRRSEARARIDLAAALRRQGNVPAAEHSAEAGLRLAYELADESAIAHALFQRGIVYRDAQATDRAVAALEESVTRHRRLGDAHRAAIALTMLGWARQEAGDQERAAACLREGATILRSVGDRAFFLFALRGLAYVSHDQGEHRRAARWYGASEAFRVALGMQHPRRNRERDQILVASLQQQMTEPEYREAFADGEAMSVEQVSDEIVAAG